MSDGLVRVSVGTRFIHDGELMQVVEMQTAATGTVVVLGAASGGSTAVIRVALRELLDGGRARLLPDDSGPQADDDVDLAGVLFAAMSDFERNELNERAAHVREVLTGYRSGSAELPAKDEPRVQYDPGMSLTSRYTAKAAELDVSLRTIKQWVADFRRYGVAGLARKQSNRQKHLGNVDDVWGETALEVMVEHTDQSRPSQSMVISRTNARVIARFGEGAVKIPSRATAYRILAELENRHPTFRHSTKRNRDIADRPSEAHGKLRPTKSLGANGFFAANHSLVLQGPAESRTVKSPKEFEELVAEEKQRITDDEVLRKRLNLLEKALQRNENTRQFFAYVSEHVEVLPEFANIDLFRQKVWQSYLKSHEELFTRVVTLFANSEARQKEIEQAAAAERTQWERVIEIFNDRFFVPFRLSPENKHRVALGQEDVLKLVFKFEEGDESTDVAREELLSVLSNGEKKALYILNVLFEMEARKASGRETLFVIDDLADSFDYKNKYAIIQYLKEMAEHTNFKLILLTHNFDFFRTLLSRGVVTYKQCFMAQKGEAKVVLSQAEHVNNPFIRAFKLNFFSDGMQRVASIPFVRNILEYTKGTDDPDYMRLTSLLHWKHDSLGITNGDLDRIFKERFPGNESQAWHAASDPVVDLIYAQADCALQADEGVNFENKIVLSIATRLQAEKFMVGGLNDQAFTDAIDGNQTAVLFNSFKNRSCGTPESTATLDTVVLMTPENIHVNSFMYEPIIDMSDVALRSLYAQVKTL